MATGSKTPKKVTLADLKLITDNFSHEIGKGVFGTVYKGTWEDGRDIAVKKLNENAPVPRDKAFSNEVRSVAENRHKNIVELVAYCSEKHVKTIKTEDGKYEDVEINESILCYEYLPTGSLYDKLFGTGPSIDWDIRFKIIKGICNGLHFLHKLDRPIIHLNLKPQNILLDNDMVPKITDFGLSRLFGKESFVLTGTVVGARGYMAPEYVYYGRISAGADIYSLGLLILQITTGEMNRPHKDHKSATDFVKQVREKWIEEYVMSEYAWLDQKMLEQMMQCIHVGLSCVELNRKNRPSINEIVDLLHVRLA
ncbi:unnamed protein product [Urochloa humidicola]